MPASLATRLAATAPAPIEPTENQLVVVVSHDCDVCQPDLTKEPWVDLVVVDVLDRAVDGALTFGKNPRLLEFQADIGGRLMAGRVSAGGRWQAPRARLIESGPSGYLNTIPAGIIPAWLSRRYIREAFPDEFNRRWEPVKRELRHVLTTQAHDLNAIYLVMDDVELPEGTDYLLVMRGTMLAERFAITELRTAAQSALDSVATLLSRCVGIDVVDWEVASEANVSLHDVRVMKHWSPYDTLSLSDEEIAQ